MKIKTIIIDDEVLARNIIKTYLSNNTQFELVEECSNGFDGLKAIQQHNPDLIFLDIQMPKISGFEMLELLTNPPLIIFSTAFDDFALKAFEVSAVDYLLKPYSKERFNEALKKVESLLLSQTKESNPVTKLLEHLDNNETYINRVVIKQNNKIAIVPTEDINYIEANDDYVTIYTSKGSFLKEKTMKYFEQHLDQNEFIRIHRSYIVKLAEIKQIELLEKESYQVLTHSGKKLPVSKTGYQKLKQFF